MTPSSPRSLLQWLTRDPEFRALGERADRLLALQDDLRRSVPASVEVVALGIERDTLLVGTAGAAAASKLRQLEPSIVAALRARGWAVDRIRFRPRPRGEVAVPPPLAPRTDIPPQALAAFANLLEGSSSAKLSSAVKDLLRHHRAR